jgi:DHA1 family tetracycline resistance protein-like MFS transporter
VVFIDMLGFGIIIPVLPYYVRSLGVSDIYIGLLVASYSVMQFVCAPLLGLISDQHGRRPVLILSISGSVVAWTLFGLGGSLFVLFAARMLAGAMGGNIATAQAYIADITPTERRAAALGLLGAVFGMGFIIGPALGAVFALDSVIDVVRNVVPAAVPITRFSLPSFVAAALSFLSLIVAISFLPETGASASTEDESLVAGLRGAMRDDRLRGLVLSFFLYSVAFSGVEVMFIPFVADFYGYAESQSALLLAYVGVLSVLIQGGLMVASHDAIRRRAPRSLARPYSCSRSQAPRSRQHSGTRLSCNSMGQRF